MIVENVETDKTALFLLKPIYEPFNQDAEDISLLMLKKLDLPSSGPKLLGYKAMVSSIICTSLRAIQLTKKQASLTRSKRRVVYIGMLIGNDHWTPFPMVGATVGRGVLQAMEDSGFLKLDPNSGKREFYTTNSGKTAYEGIMSRWSVAPKLVRLLSVVE